MPPWALVVTASIAAASGVGAVVLVSPALALVGGIASAVSALLALDGRLAASRAATALARPDPDAAGAPDAANAHDLDLAADDDPLRELLEAGPPAGGSGVLDEHFVTAALRARVDAARRSLRPLAVVCLEALETDRGRPTVPVAADEVAHVLRRTLREADVAAHAGGGAFFCVLEDTGEDGAVWTAERVRRRLVEDGRSRRFHAGVAAYPAHALEAEELQAKARAALDAARDWSTDRIEVAPGA
ncbi:MAG: diguanylate cyclase domain-containing protein [Acidimicrobiia bacterium]